MTPVEKQRYDTLHPKLQKIVDKAIEEHEKLGKDWGIFIVSGHRTKAQQDDALKRKVTKARWPLSPHNQLISLAVDLMGIRDGKLITQGKEAENICKEIAALMKKAATDLGIALESGIDWPKFKDLPHHQLKKEWDSIKRNEAALMKGATK